MIQDRRWIIIGRHFDRARRPLSGSTSRSRWRWSAAIAMAASIGAPPAAQSPVQARPITAREEPGDPPKTDLAQPLLPPRALLRIGTDDLRTQDFVTAIAFAPDGRQVAAADANAPCPRVFIFDVRTGRRVKALVAPGNRGGWVTSVAFSPDGTKLLWGEVGGEIALWDLSADRLLFREKLYDAASRWTMSRLLTRRHPDRQRGGWSRPTTTGRTACRVAARPHHTIRL